MVACTQCRACHGHPVILARRVLFNDPDEYVSMMRVLITFNIQSYFYG